MSNKPTKRDNNTGTCYYNQNSNRWIADIRWNDSNGNAQRKTFTGKSENKVRSKMDEFLKCLELNKDNPFYFCASFEEYAGHWLYDVEKIKMKPMSFERKVCTMRNQIFPYFGEKQIKDIRLKDVQDFVNALVNRNLSYSSIKKAYECLNGCIKYYFLESGINAINPCVGVVLPKNDAEDIRFFNDKECELIENEALRTYGNGSFIYRFGPGIVFLMYSGLRIGEALALNWNDIDFDNRTIRVCKNVSYSRASDTPGEKYDYIVQNSTKTKSGKRIVPMTQRAYDMLKMIHKLTGHQDFVFITSTGARVQVAYFNRCFHKMLKNRGITVDDETIGVHALRHTFATRLFKSGCDITILGHSTVRITYDIYVGVIQEQSIKAMENLD